MRLHRDLEQPVVPMGMEQPSAGVADRSEETPTNNYCTTVARQRVERQNSMLPLQQSVRGRGGQQWLLHPNALS